MARIAVPAPTVVGEAEVEVLAKVVRVALVPLVPLDPIAVLAGVLEGNLPILVGVGRAITPEAPAAPIAALAPL